MPTPTTHFAFSKPLINDPTDQDVWGNETNANWDLLDGLLYGLTPTTTPILFAASPYTISATDQGKILLVDATAGAVVIQLEAAATATNGYQVAVKKIDSSANTVTVTAASGEFIDGAATLVLSKQWAATAITSNATAWYVNHPDPTLTSATVRQATGIKGSWLTNTTALFTADQAILQNSANQPTFAANLSLNINTATAVGNPGGLDTGTQSSGFYFVYAINNGTTTSCVYSASATAPTLTATNLLPYTSWVFIGWIFFDGSNNLVGFTQSNKDWAYKNGSNLSNLPVIASGAYGNYVTPGWVAQSVTPFVPSNAKFIKLSAYAINGNLLIAPNQNFGGRDVFGNNSPWSQAANGFADANTGEVQLESTNIYAASQGSQNYLYCLGFRG